MQEGLEEPESQKKKKNDASLYLQGPAQEWMKKWVG